MPPVPLSQLALKYFINPKPGAAPSVPALVWEAPSDALTEPRWEATAAGHNAPRPRAGEPLIFMIEKGQATNNPFAMGVTLGRVDNNDLVIDDNSVSRFHCWFQQDDRTKEWAVTDAESKNGTAVDGVPAPARQRMPLKDGSKVKVGDVVMTFWLPQSLKRFVEQRFKG